MSSAATTAQINVRLSKEQKEAGDRGLAEAGLSPSEYVRLAWSGAARGASTVKKVVELLRPSSSEALAEEVDQRLAILKQGQELYGKGLARLGLHGGTVPPITEEEMQQARFDHLFGKGLE